MKPIRSIETMMITEIVGSLVRIHGMILKSASSKKYLSRCGGFLNPYLRENKNIINVNTSDTAIGITAVPAPFANAPKKTTQETSVHTSQVYGCGFTRPLKTSHKYGTFPITASIEAIMIIISFIIAILT